MLQESINASVGKQRRIADGCGHFDKTTASTHFKKITLFSVSTVQKSIGNIASRSVMLKDKNAILEHMVGMSTAVLRDDFEAWLNHWLASACEGAGGMKSLAVTLPLVASVMRRTVSQSGSVMFRRIRETVAASRSISLAKSIAVMPFEVRYWSNFMNSILLGMQLHVKQLLHPIASTNQTRPLCRVFCCPCTCTCAIAFFMPK